MMRSERSPSCSECDLRTQYSFCPPGESVSWRKALPPSKKPALRKNRFLTSRKKSFRLPEKAPSAKHAAAYLTKARGIRGELVSELMHRGVIYEAIRKSPDGKEMPMVVFPSFDEKRNAVGAECCSAYSSVRFKHIVGGSDPRFGWRFSMGNPPEGAKKLFFCESAIDAMSLFCLTGTPGVYISLAGLKDETMAHMKDFLGGEPGDLR